MSTSLPDLEKEKQAVLERLRNSRKKMRSQFASETEDDAVDHHPGNKRSKADGFPQSHVMQLILAHPGWVLAGTVLLFVIGPRKIIKAGFETGVTMLTTVIASKEVRHIFSQMLPDLLPYLLQIFSSTQSRDSQT
ncbi:hypothetical protein ACO0LG_19515 [Undibacterium sp. Ji42W]|uniref:hypothetical protein n=1 Tax=Undibacterium sp. Ji42W TaxID=3413039 RepID=UPI003BF22643